MREGGWRWGGVTSYDGEKAWSSIHHSILFALKPGMLRSSHWKSELLNTVGHISSSRPKLPKIKYPVFVLVGYATDKWLPGYLPKHQGKHWYAVPEYCVPVLVIISTTVPELLEIRTASKATWHLWYHLPFCWIFKFHQFIITPRCFDISSIRNLS
jgi:hypothetical protein